MTLRQAWVKRDEEKAQERPSLALPGGSAAPANTATGEEVATPVVNLSLVTAGSEDVVMPLNVKEDLAELATESLAEIEGTSGEAPQGHIDYDAEEREVEQALKPPEDNIPETWENVVDTRPELAIGNPWTGDWRLDPADVQKEEREAIKASY